MANDLILRDIHQAVTRDLSLLQPRMRLMVLGLMADLAEAYSAKLTEWNFQLYETWRHPERQRFLMDTEIAAPPWKSPHQYGLAAQFGVLNPDTLAWSFPKDADWKLLKRAALNRGLSVPLDVMGRVDSPKWAALLPALK